MNIKSEVSVQKITEDAEIQPRASIAHIAYNLRPSSNITSFFCYSFDYIYYYNNVYRVFVSNRLK